ncbi:MAG TPA: MarR family transcriptional regulator [Gammaproteobacteria bacterium]|nr:MarR family transcriptional regulator [Gammaproteobacteria bacterium]
MKSLPDEKTVQSWARLVRAQQLLLERVEADLKQGGLPPLRWYDVLLELHRSEPDGLRQYEISEAVLLNKYNVSRLLDRLEREGLIDRYTCESDGRGAQVRITASGKDLLKRMWKVYGIAITEHFARHFTQSELSRLALLLCKLPGVCR